MTLCKMSTRKKQWTVLTTSLGIVTGIVASVVVTVTSMLVWELGADAQTPAQSILFLVPLLTAVIASMISLRFLPYQWKRYKTMFWITVPGVISFLIAISSWTTIATHIATVATISDIWRLAAMLITPNWKLLGQIVPFFADQGHLIGTASFTLAQGSTFLLILMVATTKRLPLNRCRNCGHQCPIQQDVSRVAITSTKRLATDIARRDWSNIRNLGAPRGSSWFRFDVASCKGCGKGFFLSVFRRETGQLQKVVDSLEVTADDIRTVRGLSKHDNIRTSLVAAKIDTTIPSLRDRDDITNPNLAFATALAHTGQANLPTPRLQTVH